MPNSCLARAVLADHFDQFTVGSLELEEMLQHLHRVLKHGGFILLHSVARMPWYMTRCASL